MDIWIGNIQNEKKIIRKQKQKQTKHQLLVRQPHQTQYTCNCSPRRRK